MVQGDENECKLIASDIYKYKGNFLGLVFVLHYFRAYLTDIENILKKISSDNYYSQSGLLDTTLDYDTSGCEFEPHWLLLTFCNKIIII